MVEVFSSIKILIFEGIKLICVFLKCRVFFGLRLQYVHLACSPTPTSNRQRYSLVSLAFDKSNSELRVGRSICYFQPPNGPFQGSIAKRVVSSSGEKRHQEANKFECYHSIHTNSKHNFFFNRSPWPKEDQKRREPRSLRPSALNAILSRQEVPTSKVLIFTASSVVNPEWPMDTPTQVPTKSRASPGEKILSLTTWRILRSTSR